MPQDPDTLIPDQMKFLIEREKQRKEVHERFAAVRISAHARLEGDELVAWIRSGMAIEMSVAQHEALGLAALRQRGLPLEEWQIDPDGHILPRQSEPSSSGTTPPPDSGESTPHSDH